VKQADRTERSTTALLDAAGELIVEGGFASLTLAAIGERAGFSRGLVTARFGSKGGLIDALLDRIFHRWEQVKVQPGAEHRPGCERIVMLFEAIRYQYRIDQRQARVLWALIFEAAGPDAVLRERIVAFHRSMRDELARNVRRGQHDGSVRADVEPEAEAAQLLAELRGLAHQAVLEPDSFDLDAALGYAVQTIRQRLAPQAPRLLSAAAS